MLYVIYEVIRMYLFEDIISDEELMIYMLNIQKIG